MPIESALDRKTVSQVVSTLAEVHGNPDALQYIEKATTSCMKWGNALGSLFIDGKLDDIYAHGRKLGPEVFKNLEARLRANQAVVVGVKFPGSTDHWFTIAGDNGKARVLHAWENVHGLRAEKAMPIGMTVSLLEELPRLSYSNPKDLARLETVRGVLWGMDHKSPGDIGTSSKTRISFAQIISGAPNQAFNEANKELARISIALSEISSGSISPSGRTSFYSAASESSRASGGSSGRLSEVSRTSSRFSEGPRIALEPTHGAGIRSQLSETSRVSQLSEASRISQASRTSAISEASHASRTISQASNIEGVHATQSSVGIRSSAGVGAGLGFVLGAGGALIQGGDLDDVLEEGVKTGLGMGAAEAASAAVAKSVTPTFARLGTSVFRANAAAGVAMFGVFAIWDVAKWSKHDITAVQLRQNLATGAAGAAGGIAGGAALGAAGGAWLGPPGALIGALIGGLAGGFGGAAAGKAIDEAIWDEDEDSIMNSYEFFGWHDVQRNTRPIKPTELIVSAYMRKVEDRPKKISRNDWATVCTANLMILLRAMFPEFKTLLNLATDLRNADSKGVEIIGTAMFDSSIESLESDVPESAYIEETFDGIYIIENVETQRYLFQDGNPIKGKRGDKRGWLAHSGFASPRVVGADANYYNRAHWKILHQGGGKYFIENVETKRYLFQDGEPIMGSRGAEGGWLQHSGFESPKVVGADANYYNRAYWRIVPQGDKFFIENVETKRYLFQDGEPIKGKRGAEGGWLASSGFESPKVVGADANYYNRAYFKLVKLSVSIYPSPISSADVGDGIYIIENVETQRYVFQDGESIKGNRGNEGGWLAHSGFASPKVVGADANYYNRAYWKISHQGEGKYFIENVATKRYLFQDGEPITGNRGAEGGWLQHSGFESPKVVGADANYYNRAYWRIVPQGDNKFFIESVETKRYLFQDGEPIKGKRGAEGGWLASSGFASPKMVGADANYYNRAYFKLLKIE